MVVPDDEEEDVRNLVVGRGRSVCVLWWLPLAEVGDGVPPRVVLGMEDRSCVGVVVLPPRCAWEGARCWPNGRVLLCWVVLVAD